MTAPVIIGNAQLYLGDCREILPTLGKVDAVVTSPPYDKQRDYGKPIDDWLSIVAPISSVSHNAQILVNLGLIHRDGHVISYWDSFIAHMKLNGWRLFGWYVWDQLSGMAGDWNGRLAPSFEFIFHFNTQTRTVNKTKRTLGDGIGKLHGPGMQSKNGVAQQIKTHDGRPVQPFKIPDNVIRTTRETNPDYAAHPARFPVGFARELVEPFTSQGETVTDPFMGSGTTGVACAKLGRKFIGIEIEPKYFDIACKRIEKAYAQPDFFIANPAPAIQETLEL